MLTSKEHTDGNIYHAQYFLNEEGTDYSEESEFILDESGDLIPITACLCHARHPESVAAPQHLGKITDTMIMMTTCALVSF